MAYLSQHVLEISRETKTINSAMAVNGYIDFVPKRCITVGMKEILSSRKIRLYLNRTWQSGIVRKAVLGEVTRYVPASFCQRHSDAKFILARHVANAPIDGQLR